MAVGSMTAFLTVSVLLLLVPGADWAYAIAAGLRDRSVIPAVGGLMLGYVALTVVVVAGVAAVVAGTPSLLTALTVLGAGYLLWLGVATLRRPSVPGAAAEAPAGLGPARVLLQGAGTSGLNPKGLLLYVSLLPQFVDRHGTWPVALQTGTLGVLHVAACGVVYFGVGTLARRVLRARPSVARTVSRLSGVAMVGIGAFLLVERLVAA
ncbi:LysE family translocator [Streptomyces mobaraensis NBRC 13819 = DSM 40847]|uniref:LysE family translocator n=2 Tax=Streptomyces mobaraensis TaxID=35621 RepID=A0A5N5VZT9_STRMB|nr:LysE family translocator [Streptomyces mobaraensis]EMF00126.1 lysE type translocator family protein [Streptomyces mobaraensis NBRC 13819 = DSM 40847]KAB7834514.1 LysE family translocator [Streptomyces mobaraensis]QTT72981.1 LysE family translocator [Streptomyces mobaraensis NBRC 13819 = DSM 40847]